MRNTETFGKGKHNSTMAYNLAILRQIWLDIGTALVESTKINLYISGFNKCLWNASKKLVTTIPPLDHTLVVGPSAAPGELEKAMAAVG